MSNLSPVAGDEINVSQFDNPINQFWSDEVAHEHDG